MLRLWGTCAAVLVAALFVFNADAPTVRAGAKAELGWRVDDRLYLHYAVVSQESVEEEGAKPNLHYFHAMGYEINPDGTLRDLSGPWVFEEILFQLGSYMPVDKMREEDDWERAWNFDYVYGTQALKLNSRWMFSGVEKYERAECAVISGTHSLVAPEPADALPRWTKFELSTTTYYDEEGGLVRGIKYALRATKLEPSTEDGDPPVPAQYAWDFEYRLSVDRDTLDTEDLKKDVENAIAAGVDRLWKQQNKEGLWPYSSHKRGGTALSLLALLMCGVDSDDDRVVAAFELLRDTETDNTYDVAVSIMAYEARYITQAEREGFLKGEDPEESEQKRKLSKEDLAEVQRLTDWIIDNRNEPNEFWNYKRNHNDDPKRWDFSITQYALLGLGAAMRCGASVPPGYVKKLGEETIKQQMKDGPEIKRVVDYEPGEMKRGKRKEDRVTLSRKEVKARGWCYQWGVRWDKDTGETNSYGSMTCAGLTCLIAAADIAANMTDEARDEEFQNTTMYNQWQRDLNESMEGGFAWLEHRFSITRNPNKGRYHYYYYLYGLERVCMLADVRHLGVHDWYHEGAAALVALQDEYGGWGNAVSTSFALLFLKKGTVKLKKPVYTGGHD